MGTGRAILNRSVTLFTGSKRVSVSNVVELKCNWRNFKSWGSKTTLPAAYQLVRGAGICEKKTSVFLPKRDIEVFEIRDWVTNRADRRFEMFGRFEYNIAKYRVDREFLGTSFRFETIEDAVLFKLFWV